MYSEEGGVIAAKARGCQSAVNTKEQGNEN